MWRSSLMGYRPGRLGQNTIFGTVGLGVRAMVQAAYLIIVSRWLGAEGYGLFAGSVALLILFAPIASWGSNLIITRQVARNPAQSRAIWATGLAQTSLVGGILVPCMLAVSLFLPEKLPLVPMLMLAISELILLPITWAAASQCLALERGIASAVAICVSPIGRVTAMLLAIAGGVAATPGSAATAHFIGSVGAVAVAVAVVALVDGWPDWRSRMRIRQSLRQGTPYTASHVAESGYQEIDKVLMLQVLGAAIAGPYTVAFRIASIFLMPVTALINASLPRLISTEDILLRARTFRVVLLCGVGYGVVASIFILLSGHWVPLIFGEEFNSAQGYLALLALWPPLFAVRHSLATSLTADDRQATRARVEMAGLGLVVLLNLLLLPRMGAGSAVAALLLAEACVTATIWWLMKRAG